MVTVKTSVLTSPDLILAVASEYFTILWGNACLNSSIVQSICIYRPGFVLASDGRSCLDVDECKENSRICNGGECINNQGSFSCICGSGLLPGLDNSSCIGKNLDFEKLNWYIELGKILFITFTDINECEKDKNICGSGECINNVGTYTCQCEEGYSSKSDDNPYCTDEDECGLETHACDKNALCINNPVRGITEVPINQQNFKLIEYCFRDRTVADVLTDLLATVTLAWTWTNA